MVFKIEMVIVNGVFIWYNIPNGRVVQSGFYPVG